MTWAVVPVKRFSQGKSRLAGVLGERERERFATCLFDHALDAIFGARAIAGVLVVTDCTAVAARARDADAEVVVDEAAGTIGEAVRLGLAAVRGRDDGGAIVLMSDLPLLHADDVDAMLGALVRADVVLAPDTRDVGTNALALARLDSMPTLFGTGDSFPRHVAAAAGGALRLDVVRTPGLAFDVDTEEDYARFLELSGCPSRPSDGRSAGDADRRGSSSGSSRT